jgi:hypothetical protein
MFLLLWKSLKNWLLQTSDISILMIYLECSFYVVNCSNLQHFVISYIDYVFEIQSIRRTYKFTGSQEVKAPIPIAIGTIAGDSLILHPENQRVTMSKIVTLFFLPNFCRKKRENWGKSWKNRINLVKFLFGIFQSTKKIL